MQLFITYKYTYEVEEEIFNEEVHVEVKLRKSNKGVAISLNRIEGNILYFRKILRSIRLDCFPN